MQDGANHRVKIADLDNPDEVFNTLEEWLGITIPSGTRKSAEMENEIPGFRLEGR